MTHDMSGATAILMILMMLAMAGFSLAFLARAVPAAWRGRIRAAVRRPATPLAGTRKDGAR
jgi:hypothetical protein